MRRTRLSDVTAVTDVSDGVDLEGTSFLPLASATGLTGAAAVTSAHRAVSPNQKIDKLLPLVFE